MRLNIEDVNRTIEAIEQIDYSNRTAYAKVESALRSIPTLPLLIYDLGEGTALFRSRTQDSPELYTNIDEIGAPPASAVQQFGRCNMPSQRRFYCSDNRPTSYMELVNNWLASKSLGDKVYVTIGRWVLQVPMPTVVVPRFNADGLESEYDQQHGQVLGAMMRRMKRESAEAACKFYEFLANVFRQPGERQAYMISTAYANLAFEKDDVAAVEYPSVPFGGQGRNFCIAQEYCQANYLLLTHVLQDELTVSGLEANTFAFDETGRIVATRIESDYGRIDW